jgi:predicted metal-dependent peptidase
MISTNIPIIDFDGNKPSVGYTDFTSVYISREVVRVDERETLLLHELSHIWLRHRSRGSAKCLKQKSINGIWNNKLWNIACDLEIAYHIYTDKDDDMITRPRSSLSGAIRKIHCEDFTGAKYAEEFYDLLLEKKEAEKLYVSIDSDGNLEITDENRNTPNIPNIEELVEEVKKKINEQISQIKYERSKQQAQYSVNNFTLPKPSLSSIMDRYFGRSVIGRVKTYRRPNRRADSTNLILKGISSIPKTPKLTIYVDRSGSFSLEKTKDSIDYINKLLLKYRGRVRSDVLYFNNTLLVNDPMCGAGGTNYQSVIDNIYKDRSELSIIITDDDSAYGVSVPKNFPKCIVIPIGCTTTHIAKIIGATECLYD